MGVHHTTRPSRITSLHISYPAFFIAFVQFIHDLCMLSVGVISEAKL
jgi:hypothetical protein